jgi:tRNA modification GTPase
VSVSARTGEGVEALRDLLARLAAGDDGGEDVLLARTRHLHALDEAGAAMERLVRLAGQGGGMELAAEELRAAQVALGRMTGALSADELLGEIFARFCIGK